MSTRTPVWLWLVPLVTCGFLSPIAPFAIAVKSRTVSAWSWFAGFALAWLVAFTVIGVLPEGDDGALSSLMVGLYLLTWIGSTVYAMVKAQALDWGGAPRVHHAPVVHGAPIPYDPNSAAIAQVQALRRRREEARAVAEGDPQMARDLRIGRPDLPRHFDDGGLVDVNDAPEEAFVRALGLTAEQAAKFVEVRLHHGRFRYLSELTAYEALDHATFDRVKERLVVI